MEKIIYIGCDGIWKPFNPKLPFWVRQAVGVLDTIEVQINGGKDNFLINFPDKDHMDSALPKFREGFINYVVEAIESDCRVDVIDLYSCKSRGDKPLHPDNLVFGYLEWRDGPGSEVVFKEIVGPREAGKGIYVHRDYLPKQ